VCRTTTNPETLEIKAFSTSMTWRRAVDRIAWEPCVVEVILEDRGQQRTRRPAS
jgi:hypothetical protein